MKTVKKAPLTKRQKIFMTIYPLAYAMVGALIVHQYEAHKNAQPIDPRQPNNYSYSTQEETGSLPKVEAYEEYSTAVIEQPYESANTVVESYPEYHTAIITKRYGEYSKKPAMPVERKTSRSKIIDDIAYTIWCEAAGDGVQGMLAVGDVIRNRVKSDLFPNDWMAVIHEPKQFSCWGENGYTRIKARKDYAYNIALKLAERVYDGKIPRMTDNALFYHAKHIKPYWAKHYTKLGNVGSHVFYKTNKL